MAKGGKSTSRGSAPSFSDAPMTTDPRFAKVHTDPRFLKPKRDDTKVVVDDRFKGLFQDDKSSSKKTDKYGRKVGKGKSDAEQMKRFYRLEEEDLDPSKVGLDEEEDEEDADAAPVDYARGEGVLESSSEEESSEASDDSDDSDDSADSDSEDDDSEDDDVMIGPSSVLDREKRKKAARAARFDDEDDDGLGSDIGEIDLDEDVDEAVYAQLDAQAERAIAEGGIEDDESDSEAEASSSRKKLKGKDKARKSKSSKNKIPRGDDTCRLAAVNLDWDHVRAKDIYKVFSSIVSPTASISAADALQAHRRAAAAEGTSRARAAPAISQVRGKLLHVRVYPSDFGKERMAKEDLEGPPPEIFKGSKTRRNGAADDSSDEEITAKTIIQVDEGGEFDEEALRKYQLDRLRYYYAVATFDSKETARHVYNEIDGTEMERTANVFDLRFVPDGMEFPDGEEGRDAEFRDEAVEDVANYKGVDFKTDALRHSRVKLTWDQDDPERSKLTRMVSRGGLSKEQLRDDDFKAYLASDSEDEQDEEEVTAKSGRDRLRALLNLDGGKDGSGFGKKGKRNGGVFDDPRRDDDEEQGEMQITFMPGLSEAAAKKAANSSKKAAGEDETTLEKYLRKQKEKKERKKANRSDEQPDNKEDEEAVNGAIGSTDAGFDDPFFNQDMDMEAALAAEFGEGPPTTKPSKKSSSKSKKSAPTDDEDPAELERQRAQLTTLIGTTNDELTQDGRQHFDMKDILRQESGKDAKRAKLLKRLSKKKQREEEAFQERKGAPLVQDTFEIDAKDDRFGALMDDHRFAIDPTHPGFAKTKAMQKIMDERRARLDRVSGDGMPVEREAGRKAGKSEGDGKEDGELSALVEKLKRRSNGAGGEDDGQRAKRRKRKSNA